MSGSTWGGVVGAAIGYWAGGAQGARTGWMIGSAVGSVVDPDVIPGQRLTDAQIQTSSEGAPRPFGYGVFVCAGNVIQIGPLEEHEDSGKGGPVQQKFTYTMTYAIRVCEGPVAGIRRIWRDDKLVYDVRDPNTPDDGITDAAKWASDIQAVAGDTGKFSNIISIYLGDEDQLPDPALEALPAANGGGAGNVPAYRGSCYVVFRDDDLTERQGTIPQYRFEVAAGATISLVTSDNAIYAAVQNSGNLIAGHDPTDFPNTLASGLVPTASPTLVQSAAGRVFHLSEGVGRVSTDRGFSWQACDVPATGEPRQIAYARNLKHWYLLTTDGLYSSVDGVAFQSVTCPIPSGHAAETLVIVTYLGADVFLVGGSGFVLSTATGPWVQSLTVGAEIRSLGVSPTSVVLAVGTAGLYRSTDYGVTWSSPISHPLPASQPVTIACSDARHLILDAAGNCAYSDDDGINWDLGGAMPESVAGNGVGKLIYDSPYFVAARRSIHTTLDGVTWTTVYTGVGGGAAPEINALAKLDFTGAQGIPDVVGYYVINGTVQGVGGPSMLPGTVYLGDVERDIASRVGITAAQFDTTQIDAIRVRGMVVGQPMPAAEVLRTCQQAYFHDIPEWGDYTDTSTKLRAILRGGPALFAITDDDLVESDDDEDTRAQAVEFPRKINLIAPDPNADYEPSKETFSRRTDNVKAVGESTVSLPVSLLRDEIAQKVEIMGQIAWTEAEGRCTFELPEEFSALTTSDPLTKSGKRWRAERVEYGDGSLKVEAVRDRISAYTSTATGTAGVPTTPPPSNLRGPTIFAAWNGPQLRSADNVPGIYVAARGLLPGWVGARLFLSVDSGASEQAVLDMTAAATMGTLTESCTSSSEPISVVLDGGVLESVTLAQIAARANAFAILTSDVCEVGQFQTATETAADQYDLTDITRGELSTTAAAHATGDRFVLLDAAVYFLPVDPAYAGQTLILHPVTFGTSAANNDSYSLVYEPPTYILDGGGA